jgi:hypothetical protein
MKFKLTNVVALAPQRAKKNGWRNNSGAFFLSFNYLLDLKIKKTVYLAQSLCFMFISKFVWKPYRPGKYLANCVLDPNGCVLIIIVRGEEKLQHFKKFQQSSLIR